MKGSSLALQHSMRTSTLPHAAPYSDCTPEADGTWQSFGLINDPALLENAQLITLLEDEVVQ
jgi:hypothetical protein